jgi:hypothetical protein
VEKLESEYLAELNRYQKNLQEYREEVKQHKSGEKMPRRPTPTVKADYKLGMVKYFDTMEAAKEYAKGRPGSGGGKPVTVTVTTSTSGGRH